MKALLLCALVLFTASQVSQADDAYQLLRESPDGYSEVRPGRLFAFPEDHLPHPDYRIEWWYLTANLTADNGEHYGIHWTLFRMALSAGVDPGGWSSNQMWMAHAAVSTNERFLFEERFGRGGVGVADVAVDESDDLVARMDNWVWRGKKASLFPGSLQFTVDDPGAGEVQVMLEMQANTPWVLQGQAGFSQKSERGQASYYYSQPHIQVTGNIQIQGVQSTMSGKAWLDREWSSQPLAPDQPGWDWFSLHFDDGSALMVYRLRQNDGDHWLSGSFVAKDGQAKTISRDQIKLMPLSEQDVDTGDGVRSLPLTWNLQVAGLGLPDINLTVEAGSPNHWLSTAFPYWEGPVKVTGTKTGKGYMELTGY